MINGVKNRADVEFQQLESKLGTETGFNSTSADRNVNRKSEVVHGTLRVLCLMTSVIALSLMVTAKQASAISIYGFNLPLHSKWSFSDSFVYLVGVSAAVAAHSMLQLVISGSRLMRGSPIIPSRNHGWLIFAGDQILAYAMMSAGSTALGVSRLSHTGIRHSALPNFCKPLHHFCDRVVTSIVFTFFGCCLLAILAVLDVLLLPKD